MNEKIKSQVMEIRNSGATNMLDYKAVQRIAFDLNFYELVVFIEEHRKEYIHFIMTGEENVCTN